MGGGGREVGDKYDGSKEVRAFPNIFDDELSSLKGHGNEPVFPMFLHKSLWPRSLTLHFKPSDFGLEFSEIFVFENRLPASVSRGVNKIAWSIHFFKPLNNSIVIVNYIPGLFFAKLVL
jgi:hypothetical protein